MKKYLFPSLDNQRCKQFIWILKIGKKSNITFIKSLINFKNSFEKKVSDILITTRINYDDYDDRVYYDAVNDVRKQINSNKPLMLYEYNRDVQYYEIDNK